MTLVYDANLKFSLHTNCQLKQILAGKTRRRGQKLTSLGARQRVPNVVCLS